MKNATHNQLNNSISARNAAATTTAINLIHHKTGSNTNAQTVNGPKVIKAQSQANNRPPNNVLNDHPQNIVRPQHLTTKQFFTSSATSCMPHAKALYDFNSKETT